HSGPGRGPVPGLELAAPSSERVRPHQAAALAGPRPRRRLEQRRARALDQRGVGADRRRDGPHQPQMRHRPRPLRGMCFLPAGEIPGRAERPVALRAGNTPADVAAGFPASGFVQHPGVYGLEQLGGAPAGVNVPRDAASRPGVVGCVARRRPGEGRSGLLVVDGRIACLSESGAREMVISKKGGTRTRKAREKHRLSPPGRALKWLRAHELRSGGIRTHSNHGRSYQEVTGYLIPTLREYGECELATRLVLWLLARQRTDGAFTDPDQGEPYVFDTGQVLRGLLASEASVPAAREAARRAADWLCAQMVDGGRG